jgi:hypothetical protein
MTNKQQTNSLPKYLVDGEAVWPFPIINNVRTKQSEQLMNTYNKPQRDDCQDFEDATW